MLLILSLLMPAAASANNESFKEAYQSYQDARKAKNWSVALQSSDQALQQGLKLFEKDGENITNLRFNYARELVRSKQYQPAVDQFKLCLEAKSKNHGSQSTELVDSLLELGKSTAYLVPADAAAYFKRALDIANKSSNKPLAAKIQLTAGNALFRSGELKLAKNYLRDSRNFFVKQGGPNDIRAGMAGLNLGRIEFEDGENRKASKTLTESLTAFSSDDATSRQFNAATRKMLVVVLETLKESDDATQHCVGFANARSVNGNADAERLFEGRVFRPPLLGTRDKNGIANNNAGGNAVVVFDVDKAGFVINPKISSSTSSTVNSLALKTARSLRYSPRLADGEPIIAKGLEFHFEMRDDLRFGGL
jgi:tetratricopeptide (TPR) repeat protein